MLLRTKYFPKISTVYCPSHHLIPLFRSYSSNHIPKQSETIPKQSTTQKQSTIPKHPKKQAIPENPLPAHINAKLPSPRFMRRLLHVRNVSHTTINGKMRQTWAMVVLGDRDGRAGYGEGRSTDFNTAIKKAEEHALKNLVHIDRLDNRTIFSDIEESVCKTTVRLFAASPGYGISANNNINEIAQCFGISDMAAKVIGSTNPMNVVKATFKALTKSKTPEEIARVRGKNVAEVTSTYYGVPYDNLNRSSQSTGFSR